MRIATSVTLSMRVPASSASSSAARVVLLVLPVLHPQLMVAVVGSSQRGSGGVRACGDGVWHEGVRRRREACGVQACDGVRLAEETGSC
jgi:hypothetical protein